MTKEQILHCLSVLKEVRKEFWPNTSLDTVIKSFESQIKELENET